MNPDLGWLLVVPSGWALGAILGALRVAPPLREPWMMLTTVVCFATAWWPLGLPTHAWAGPLACVAYGAAGGLAIWNLLWIRPRA